MINLQKYFDTLKQSNNKVLGKTDLFNKLGEGFLIKQKFFDTFKISTIHSKPKKYFRTNLIVYIKKKNTLRVKNKATKSQISTSKRCRL